MLSMHVSSVLRTEQERDLFFQGLKSLAKIVRPPGVGSSSFIPFGRRVVVVYPLRA